VRPLRARDEAARADLLDDAGEPLVGFAEVREGAAGLRR
jgi:hypothetical protein